MTGILCALPMIGAPTATSSGTPTLLVTLDSSSVSGTSRTPNVVTNGCGARASQGSSPYTYDWEYVSGDSAIVASSSSSQSTSFQRTGCLAGTSYSAQWRCLATDSEGAIGYSSNLSVTVTSIPSGGGGGGGGGTSGGGTFNGLANATISAEQQTASVTVTYSINSDGTVTGTGGFSNTWNSSTTAGSGYEVRATVTSGSLTSGTTGSWLALSSNRSWAVTDSTQNDVAKTVTMTIEIRAVGTTTNLATATINFSANALSTL